MEAPEQLERSVGQLMTPPIYIERPALGRGLATAPDASAASPATFIGRRAEVLRCLGAVAPAAPGWGVAIAGPAGSGKTALALEVAQQARAAGSFDSYLFVAATPLGADDAPATALDLLAREALRQLGDRARLLPSAQARQQALLNALRARRVLLIWDGLEPRGDDERRVISSFLARLPASAKLIITGGTPVGAPAATLMLDRLGERDADALVDSLRWRDPRVAAALDEAGPEVCRELREAAGGLPLALRLALGLLAEGGQSAAALTSRLRALPPADQARALLDAALACLGAAERAALAALLTFQRGAKAEELAAAAGTTPADAAGALARLAALALVWEPERGSFALQTVVRDAMSASLAGTAAPSESVAVDHSGLRRALRGWVERAGNLADEPDGFEQLDREWPSLEAAAQMLYQLSGLPGVLSDQLAARLLNDLAKALAAFLRDRSYWDAALRLGEWAYDAACALGGWQSAGWRAYQVAWAHYLRADTDRAALWVDRMAEALGRAGARGDGAALLRMRGLIAEQRGDLLAAERLLLDALASYQRVGSPANQMTLLGDLGAVAQRLQHFDRAADYYQRSLGLAEQLGSQPQQAICANNLGLLSLERSWPAQARQWFERELELATDLDRLDLQSYAQLGLARVLEIDYRFAEALALAEQALALQEQLESLDRAAAEQLVGRLRRRGERR